MKPFDLSHAAIRPKDCVDAEVATCCADAEVATRMLLWFILVARHSGRCMDSDLTAYCRHAVKKACDGLPGYIAAKLAGSRKAKQRKQHIRQVAGSPSRLTGSPRGSTSPRISRSPRGIQMTSRSKQAPKDR